MPDEKGRISVVLNPQQLKLYADIHPELPVVLTKASLEVNRQEFVFALLQSVFGFVLALTVVGGAIFLALHGHDTVAGVMLGAGAISMVTGFQMSRLNGSKPRMPGQISKRSSPGSQDKPGAEI